MDKCCCFTTDLGYLFPTLLSAIQARAFLDREVADVIILLFASDLSGVEVIAEICQRNQLKLLVVDTDILQGHTTMYARLFLCDLLPENYKRVLYLDGDTQIRESLNGLIDSELPDNHAFAAVPDPMAISLHVARENEPAIQAYFKGLDVDSQPATPYFNSGVLLINLQLWAEIARDALACLKDTPALCVFQDQSALNFAGHRKFTPMSFRWNFPIFFRNCGLEGPIQPRVYHFMSKPKPWEGSFPPWNRHFLRPYLELIADYPELQSFLKTLSLQARVKYLCQQNIKRLQETVTWRYSSRRPAVLEFDAATKF